MAEQRKRYIWLKSRFTWRQLLDELSDAKISAEPESESAELSTTTALQIVEEVGKV